MNYFSLIILILLSVCNCYFGIKTGFISELRDHTSIIIGILLSLIYIPELIDLIHFNIEIVLKELILFIIMSSIIITIFKLLLQRKLILRILPKSKVILTLDKILVFVIGIINAILTIVIVKYLIREPWYSFLSNINFPFF
jgi:uncharacterized membrane protein required for colicin V production